MSLATALSWLTFVPGAQALVDDIAPGCIGEFDAVVQADDLKRQIYRRHAATGGQAIGINDIEVLTHFRLGEGFAKGRNVFVVHR